MYSHDRTAYKKGKNVEEKEARTMKRTSKEDAEATKRKWTKRKYRLPRDLTADERRIATFISINEH